MMNQTWLPSHTGPTGIDDDAPFHVVFGDEREEDGSAEIETVHDRERAQKHADQKPPDDAQCFVAHGLLRRGAQHRHVRRFGFIGTKPDVFGEKVEIGDEQRRIEHDKSDQTGQHVRRRPTDETPSAVGRTSSITQGWRPYSATIQPSSAAIQGSGRLRHAARRNRR